jgi:hypothetical protein
MFNTTEYASTDEGKWGGGARGRGRIVVPSKF